ncbi:MAG: YceI family protein [Candidatus Omnitrophica bacterium]|nr:YceI family protein [Candidatus Omnitrophota bacterium]
MKMLVVLNMAVAFGLFCSGISWAGDHTYRLEPAESSIGFSFRSTLHGVQGQAHQLTGSLTADPDGVGLVKNGRVIIDVGSMDTQEPQRDINMKKMLEQEKFPSITFEILGTQPLPGGRVLINGQLMIRDVRLPVEIEAAAQMKDGVFILSGATPLSLKKFALKPPSVAMFIRVFDRVTVTFTAVFKEGA